MDSFAYGNTLRLSATFQNPTTKAFEDPVAAVVCTVTLPDGSTSLPAVVRDSLGRFHANVLPTVTQKGTWSYRFAAGTSGADPASAESSYFLIRD